MRGRPRGNWSWILLFLGVVLLSGVWIVDQYRRTVREERVRALREAARRDAELRVLMQRAREAAERAAARNPKPDAGWICDRFPCRDVQRPGTSSSREPPLIRDVPSGFGRSRR